MPLMPARVKYRKMHRGSRSGMASRGNTVAFGEYGLQSLGRAWVDTKQLEAARVALEAGVRRLVLTHISSRYNRDASELLAEAKAVFPETAIARDGMTVDVPYADAETD